MEILVRGKNCTVSPELKATAQEKIGKIARFTSDATRVEVDFVELRNPSIAARQQCEVTVHLKKHFVKAHATATEPEAALDLVIDKVEHQVAKIKDKRIKRSHPRGRLHHNGLGEVIPIDVSFDHEAEAKFVKSKQFVTTPMDPEEAAVQMDLLGHDFYLFTNAETGHAAVVYRRNDGHLGLIETPS
jgi:putative sigma-54 modulation protein